MEQESLEIRALKMRARVQNTLAGMFMPAEARAAVNAMAELLAEVAAAVVDLRGREAPARAALDETGVSDVC